MRRFKRSFGVFLLGAALVAPLGLQAAGPRVSNDEHHKTKIKIHRYYDPEYRDYHYWNENEDRAYRHWLEDQRESYQDYAKLQQAAERVLEVATRASGRGVRALRLNFEFQPRSLSGVIGKSRTRLPVA